MLQPGSQFLGFMIAQKIGKGQFGEIYSAIDQETGIIWALKIESSNVERKTLAFEFQVLAQIQSSPSFPRLGIFGTGPEFSFYSMEFLGPSVSGILKVLPEHRLSLSSAFRASYFALKAIESFHCFGFIHRDIKPGNLLTREGYENPICLIDYGLSRVYVDSQTGKHLEPRKNIGFRGTKAYASPRAHQGEDLSRKDDLISWYFMFVELLFGPLPWRGATNSSAIYRLKVSFDARSFTASLGPELFGIWQCILSLGYKDKPNYQLIYDEMRSLFVKNSIKMDEQYDWAPIIKEMRSKIAQRASTYSPTVHNCPKIGRVKMEQEGIETALLHPSMTVSSPFSDEEPAGCCCCMI